MNIVPRVWRVVAPDPSPTNPSKLKVLSRDYHVESAAQQFAQLAQKAGHPKAFVETLKTLDE